jgi:hypothetical protein
LGDIPATQTLTDSSEQEELENAIIQMRLHMDEDALNTWYNYNNLGYNFQSDQEIIASLITTQDEQVDEESINATGLISHQEAYDGINKYMLFALQQPKIKQSELKVITSIQDSFKKYFFKQFCDNINN